MQPSSGCIVKDSHARANSAEGGTGTDARPSASRTAGRTSAPPGRGQAAKAVFRRGGMSRIRRMRGPPQAGRETRRQARTTTERPNAPAPTARDFAPAADAPARKGPDREADAAEANLAIGERCGARARRPFPLGANGWGGITRMLGRSAGDGWAHEPPLRIPSSGSAEIAVPPCVYKCGAIFMSGNWGISNLKNQGPWCSHGPGFQRHALPRHQRCTRALPA